MSFRDYCDRALIDPATHLALSRSTSDIVPQPAGDMVRVGPSTIHGEGVFPIGILEGGQSAGLLLDTQFKRTSILGRFINHSDNPSACLNQADAGFSLVARRQLLPWNEITMDYTDTILLRQICEEFGL